MNYVTVKSVDIYMFTMGSKLKVWHTDIAVTSCPTIYSYEYTALLAAGF